MWIRAEESLTDHFSFADWVDFTHRLLPAPKTAEMQDHLNQGCDTCQRNSSFWSTLAEIGSREATFEPPAETVLAVKSAYRSEQPIKKLLEWATLAHLVFDSFVQPSLVAVRATAQTSRQLIHESEPFTIDLRLEPDSSRKRVYLTGQIINAARPNDIAEGIDVVLLKGAEQVEKTEAGPTGEFCLDFNVAEDLQLFLNIRGQRGIAIALPDLAA